MGLIPFLIIKLHSPALMDITANISLNTSIEFFLLLIIPVVIPFINCHAMKNEKLSGDYPELKLKEWNTGYMILSATGWAVYLAGYEFLFRGFLLSSTLNAWGIIPSIIINTFIYSAAHLHKNRREVLGSIPFGIVLCLMAIYTNSIILPFITHLSLAVSSEYFALKHKRKTQSIYGIS